MMLPIVSATREYVKTVSVKYFMFRYQSVTRKYAKMACLFL